jgi:hypothetical protein
VLSDFCIWESSVSVHSGEILIPRSSFCETDICFDCRSLSFQFDVKHKDKFVALFSIVGYAKNLKVTYKVLLDETWMWIATRMVCRSFSGRSDFQITLCLFFDCWSRQESESYLYGITWWKINVNHCLNGLSIFLRSFRFRDHIVSLFRLLVSSRMWKLPIRYYLMKNKCESLLEWSVDLSQVVQISRSCCISFLIVSFDKNSG